MSAGAFEELQAALGKRRVAIGPPARKLWSRELAPQVTVLPESASELGLALEAARKEGLRVAVCGAGSRLGAREARRLGGQELALLDLRELSGPIEIRPASLWMAARAGTPVAELFERAARMACRPVGLEESDPGTLGGFLSSAASMPDRILGIPQPPVLALEAVLPSGKVIRSLASPRAATGPDVFSLLLGTGGAFGVICSALVKLEPLPERRLLIGFRFPGLERALAAVRWTVSRGLPPAACSVVADGEAGRRKVRLWVRFEGQARLSAHATRAFQAEAERLGGKLQELDQVRDWEAELAAWRAELAAPVRWSELTRALRAADRLPDGGYARAVLDRPEPTGCRLRLEPAGKLDAAGRKAWQAGLDPDGAQAAAVDAARSRLAAVRAELDPQGLLNPQSWPLAWPGGAA
ncbi:MAG: FAD-binding oxidoreductase [Deltaproteobacteria bacterium]|nr:FAD-binding oxidoreductase [Deltaproteobacteria bacterium]